MDRLPFLDLPNSVFPAPVATLSLSNVPGGGSRSGVSRRGSSSASTFDLRGCPSSFLEQEPVCPSLLGDGHDNHREH